MAPALTFRDLLERYQRGDRDFSGSELDSDPGNGNLSGACLDGIDLSHSFIFASFKGASHRGARFHGANVKSCDFSEADLSDADFSDAALCATTFIGARMTGARFKGAFVHSWALTEGEQPDW